MRLAASAGLHLDDWQQEVLYLGLSEDDEGKWATREVDLVVGRQNGKGSILEALELGGLFLFEDCKLIVHSAHEFATSSEHFLRIWGLIENSADLLRKVKAVHRAHGQEGIELFDGTRLKFKTRTKGGGRGHSGDLVVWDEAMILGREAVSATWPIMSARVNPQAWVTGSAPLEGDESEELRKTCKIGRIGDPDVTFIEYCAEAQDDLDDPDVWARCNPGYPHRLSERAIRNERRKMTDEDFARERLGLWIDPDDDSEWIPEADWLECLYDGQITGTPTFALEVGDDRKWSSFCTAGDSTEAGCLHGELVDYRRGTDWCAERAVALRDTWKSKLVILRGSPAAALVNELQTAGLTYTGDREKDDLVLLTSEEHANACGQFYDRVLQHRFRHRDQAALDVAVRGAVPQSRGDTFVLSRRKSTVDITPVVGVIGAAYWHSVANTPPVTFVGGWR